MLSCILTRTIYQIYGPSNFRKSSLFPRFCQKKKTQSPQIQNHTALKPPSRLSTQLFAYLFVARKTAASAISLASPKRDRGMAFKASFRAGSVMARFLIC